MSELPVRFAFDDWRRAGKSIYDTDEGIELSIGDFHSGTVFDGTIDVDADHAEQLRAALASKSCPVFMLFEAGCSPPAPAIDVAESILTDIEMYLRNAGDSELVYGHVLTLIQQRGRALDIEKRPEPKPAIDVEGLDDALMRVRAHIDDAGNYTGLVYRAEVEQVIRACFK